MSGTIAASGGTLTIAADVINESGAFLKVQGRRDTRIGRRRRSSLTVNNGGTIELNAVSALTQLVIAGTVNLDPYVDISNTDPRRRSHSDGQ